MTNSSYHQTARTTLLPGKQPRWWRPVLELLLFFLFTFLFSIAVIGGGEIILPQLGLPGDALLGEDLRDPYALTGLLLIIAILLPAALLAARLGGRRFSGFLWSVTGRIRWKLVKRAVALALVVVPVVLSLNFMLAAAFDPTEVELRFNGAAWASLGIILVVVPFQAAAEEIVFRGVLPQAFGVWLRSPWLAYALSTGLFVAGHLYNWVGLIDILIFAICMIILTHVSGGLEYAVGIHTVNNVLVCAAGAFGLADPNLVEVPLYASIVASAGTIFMTWWLISKPAEMPGVPHEQLAKECSPQR